MFKYGKLAEELTVFTDSDWAGCKETRRSSSAGVMKPGRDILKAYTRKQRFIAKSSREAELSAAALGEAEAKGVQSMMCDMGFAAKPVLAIDAKATEHIFHRQGIGKLKHIPVGTGRDQIPETASAQSQERRKRRRLGNETTQQYGDCEALSHVGVREHG